MLLSPYEWDEDVKPQIQNVSIETSYFYSKSFIYMKLE